MEKKVISFDLMKDSYWVQAVMYFPRDEYLRESWYSVMVMADLIENNNNKSKIELDEEFLKCLMYAPSIDQLKEKTVEAVKKGVVAGDFLSSIYLMHRFELSEPSINKATHICQMFAAETEYGDATNLKKSRRQIKEIFNEFKTVSHLWGAYRLNKAYKFSDESKLFSENLEFFLEVSAGLLEFGTTFIPYRARPAEPILVGEEMWGLPESVIARHLESKVIPDRLITFLENYSANEYQY